ncbi:Hypothetical predicted protein [Lecanosticta acicola]|uniref:Uncharacterized protein n=1 Tax=Lecanosticta acicola TaxID=111012 RepID=A0AAI8Z9N8_9PEZI|nr:Hypothetical predicted protein [Lecanosticta acicola]
MRNRMEASKKGVIPISALRTMGTASLEAVPFHLYYETFSPTGRYRYRRQEIGATCDLRVRYSSDPAGSQLQKIELPRDSALASNKPLACKALQYCDQRLSGAAREIVAAASSSPDLWDEGVLSKLMDALTPEILAEVVQTLKKELEELKRGEVKDGGAQK